LHETEGLLSGIGGSATAMRKPNLCLECRYEHHSSHRRYADVNPQGFIWLCRCPRCTDHDAVTAATTDPPLNVAGCADDHVALKASHA
jgi:hypothetical protein